MRSIFENDSKPVTQDATSLQPSPALPAVCSWLYLGALVLMIIGSFPPGTSAGPVVIFGKTVNEWGRHLRYLAALIACASYLLSARQRPSWLHLVSVTAVLTAFVTFYCSRYSTLLWMTLMVVCAWRVDYNKILYAYLITVVTQLIFYYWLAATGRSPMLDFETPFGIRHSFGGCYPTDFAAHILYLAIALTLLRRRCLGMLDIVLDLGLALFCHTQCHARSATYCLVLLALIIVVAITLRNHELPTPQTSRILCLLLVTASIACCLGFLLLAWNYDPDVELYVRLDGWLSGRLSISHGAYSALSITPFGQEFKMVGFGGGTDVAAEGGYFFLDSWYMQALMRWGVVGVSIAMAAVVALHVRFSRKGSFLLPVLLILVCIHCITDQFMTTISYNCLLLALFATLPALSALPPTESRNHTISEGQ